MGVAPGTFESSVVLSLSQLVSKGVPRPETILFPYHIGTDIQG